jgi:hypothetical protein
LETAEVANSQDNRSCGPQKSFCIKKKVTCQIELFTTTIITMSESRLDVTSEIFTETPVDDFLISLDYDTELAVHLSGLHLDEVLDEQQLQQLMEALGNTRMTELFAFRGDSQCLTSDMLAKLIQKAKNLKVIMLWQFSEFLQNIAAAIRGNISIQRVTLNLPCPGKPKDQVPWATLDVVVMGFAEMASLQVLQIRCISSDEGMRSKQQESIISPEALALLLNSSSIQSLYLENCGLMDDHMDIMLEELPKNKTLTLLDVKHNLFTEDALYTTGQLLPKCHLRSLDLSGVAITEAAGLALEKGMRNNQTLLHLELEGDFERYSDEFHVPEGHTNAKWMQDITYQLRLNRAYNEKSLENITDFCEALSCVSDDLSCLYHFLRKYSTHGNRLTVPPPYQCEEA